MTRRMAPTYGHPAVLPTEGLARNTIPFDTTTNYHFHLELGIEVVVRKM